MTSSLHLLDNNLTITFPLPCQIKADPLPRYPIDRLRLDPQSIVTRQCVICACRKIMRPTYWQQKSASHPRHRCQPSIARAMAINLDRII